MAAISPRNGSFFFGSFFQKDKPLSPKSQLAIVRQSLKLKKIFSKLLLSLHL
jgi:hypothetical protein